MFLPGLLLGLASCWHRGILKTFLAHPSIILMPTFTHFTFASSTKWCKDSAKEEGAEGEGEKEKKAGGETEEPFIIFSAKFTLLNLLIATVAIIVYCLSMASIDPYNKGLNYLTIYLYYSTRTANIPFILVPILGLLLTLLSLLLTSTRQTCCPRKWKVEGCCCTCFILPRVEYGVLLARLPHSHYVLGDNGKPELAPEYEEVKIEETEMANTEEAGSKED